MFPGLNSKEIREIIPEIEIPEDAQISDTEGWCRMEKVEEWKEMYERCKEVMKQLKELARTTLKDKTVFAVSHGWFMSSLYCLVTQQPHNDSFIPHNNALMIIDFPLSQMTHSSG